MGLSGSELMSEPQRPAGASADVRAVRWNEGRTVAKWGPLAGEYVETRVLAEWLRTVVGQHGRSLRALEARIPYGRTAISENLSGRQRPEWEFVEALLRECVPDDLGAQAKLIPKARFYWEAADPTVATRLPEPDPDLPAADLVPVQGLPGEIQEAIWALGVVAEKQDLVARAQLSVSENLALTNDLLGFQIKFDTAVEDLRTEREALRQERDRLSAERSQHGELRTQLESIREQLVQTQERLEQAESLQADTQRRLDEAERQRRAAEQLRLQAAHQLQQALIAITDTESEPASADEAMVTTAADDRPTSGLLGPVDQQIAREVLRRVDASLSAQQTDLTDLAKDIAPVGTDMRTSTRTVTGALVTEPDAPQTGRLPAGTHPWLIGGFSAAVSVIAAAAVAYTLGWKITDSRSNPSPGAQTSTNTSRPSPPAEGARGGQRLGTPDFAAYCRTRTLGRVVLDHSRHAYGYTCSGSTDGIDVQAACDATYSPPTIDRIADFGGAVWECWATPRGRLGTLDLKKYCGLNGRTAKLKAKNVYGWTCNGETVDPQKACATLYPGTAISRFRAVDEPSSWECWG
jgi:hypothetical protein